MQETHAKLVYPLLRSGLVLQERLQRGEPADFVTERRILKGLLLTDLEARRFPDFGGDEDRDATTDRGVRGSNRFLGIRYALACWLDEIFIFQSPWGTQWNEQKLEMELYQSNDRAWKFWEQARLAEARLGKDALEVCYLCVMLGFCGELRPKPDQLQAWSASVKQSLGQIKEREWPYAAEVDPPTHVPPLRGRERLQRMLMTAGLALLLLIPVVAFFLVRRLGQ